MRIREAELKACAFSAGDFPKDNLPEVAFLGRSNVGKSSLINRLLERKNLARTSSTPGKTRGLYFYLVEKKYYFVDLPGYGYARVSKSIRSSWTPLIEGYLGERSSLRGCVHLIDCRHRPTDDDRLMARWLRDSGRPAVVVATKADKLSKGALLNRLEQIRRDLDLDQAGTGPGSGILLTFSARTGKGRDLVWKAVRGLLDGGGL